MTNISPRRETPAIKIESFSEIATWRDAHLSTRRHDTLRGVRRAHGRHQTRAPTVVAPRGDARRRIHARARRQTRASRATPLATSRGG